MTAVNRLMDFYNVETYNFSSRKDYYSFSDYRRYVIGNVLNVIDKKTHKNPEEISLEEIVNYLSEDLVDINNSKSIENNVLELVAINLFNSLYEFNITTVANLDKNLYDLLSNTKLPKQIVIERFVLPRLILLFPIDNKENYFVVVFDYITNKDNEELLLSIVKLDKQRDLLSEKYQLYRFPLNEEIDASKLDKNPDLKIIYNFLLWQQSRLAEIIDSDEVIKPIIEKKGFGQNVIAKMYPRLIGDNYSYNTITNANIKRSMGSPRTHWRSGHWRKQPVGNKKEKQYRNIWIKPFLING